MNTSPSAAKAAHSVYMPQEDLLFPWRSILANVTLGLEVQGVCKMDARRRARELFPVFWLAGRFRAGAFAAVEQELHEESHRAVGTGGAGSGVTAPPEDRALPPPRQTAVP